MSAKIDVELWPAYVLALFWFILLNFFREDINNFIEIKIYENEKEYGVVDNYLVLLIIGIFLIAVLIPIIIRS